VAGGPKRLTVFLGRFTARTVHDLLDAELIRRARLAGVDLPVWIATSDEARELAMTHRLIAEWLASHDDP
jgi:hypothetical protein